MNTVIQFPGAYTYTLEANPGVARAFGFVREVAPCTQHTFMSNGLCFECGTSEPLPTREPMVRADVVDATIDAYMIARLVRDYGCSKRDIANTFGLGSTLGKCAPIWSRTALVATMRSKWSAV